MAVLPQHLPLQPGNWNPLNDFLSVGMNNDGTAKNSAGPVVNVKDTAYAGGAKGDFSQDDLPAIQAAADVVRLAGGGILWFPAGNYATAGTVLYGNRTHILGPGDMTAQIYQTSGTGPVLAPFTTSVQNEGVLIENLTVTANGNQVNNTGGILLQKVYWSKIRNVCVSYTNSYAIKVTGSTFGDCMNNSITGCRIENLVSGAGIRLTGATNSRPDGTTIMDTTINSAAGTAFLFEKGTDPNYSTDGTNVIACRTMACPTIIDSEANYVRWIANRFEVVSGTMTATLRAGSHKNQFLGNSYATYGDPSKLLFTDSSAQPATRLGEVTSGITPLNTFGTGSPEGALIGDVSSIYQRTDGAAGSSLWLKESGSGNTGWLPTTFSKAVALTYSGSISTDRDTGDTFKIVATNGTAFTINNPTNALLGQQLTYDIKNSSGGAHGAITWGATFLNGGAGTVGTGAFAGIANGKRRTISFYYDGTNWIELSRTADI